MAQTTAEITIRLNILKPIAMASKDQRLVFGWANWSVDRDGEIVTDLHGDQIPPEILEKAAYNFVVKYREGGLEHEDMGVATLVESAFVTPEKLKAMGIKDKSYEGSAWWVGFRVDNEDVWDDVKKGKLPAFSIGGYAVVEE